MYLLSDFMCDKQKIEPVMRTFSDLKIVYQDLKKELDEQGKNLNEDDGMIGIILTKEMLMDSSYLYYLEMVHSLFMHKKMDVVTALYGIDAFELPRRAEWLLGTCLIKMQCEMDQYMFSYYCAGRILNNMYREKSH